MKIAAVDLFCGAGGLTHGLIAEGIKVKAGVDIDPACEYPFKANNKPAKFIKKDVGSLTAADIKAYLKNAEYSVLAGCAPCQPFSTYTQGQDTESDSKWRLLYDFLKLAKEVQPDVLTMENVPHLKKHSVYDDFVKGLENIGYKVTSYVIDCTEIGIPQTRKRIVLFASKYGPVALIKNPKGYRKVKTVRQAIKDLPVIRAGSQHKKDGLHKASKLSPTNLKRIKASKPGGTWRDWDEALVAKCHTEKQGRTYPSVYGRMSWDEPAPTITTQCFGFGNGRFGHPTQARGISLREAAILQSFPAKYKFAKSSDEIHMKTVGRLIGNAVPVKLGRVIGQSIVAHLKQSRAKSTIRGQR